MKKFKNIFLITIIGSFVGIIVFLFLIVFHVGCGMDTLWSTLTSVLASLFFSAVVSYIVQKILDDKEENTKNSIKAAIREREIAKITSRINSFVSTYHDCEQVLIDKYKFIKDSFSDGKLTLDIIVQNLCYAEELIKVETDTDTLEDLNSYMINSTTMREHYNDTVKFLQECANQFRLLNDIYQNTIFTQDEIDALAIMIPIHNTVSIDSATRTKFYLSNLFDLITKFSVQLNIYVNWEWVIVALMFVEFFGENSLEKEYNVARAAVEEYYNNQE